MAFAAGCIGNSLKREIYDKDTGKLVSRLEITNLKSMVSTQTKSLALSVKDGNDFSATLLVIDSNVVASPESAEAIGDAFSNVLTGGVSGALKGAVK